MNVDTMWNILTELEIATDKELELVTYINGYSIETLNDVLYVRTGYDNIDELLEEY